MTEQRQRKKLPQSTDETPTLASHLEGQAVTPGPGALACVGSDLEDVVLVELEGVDELGGAGGVHLEHIHGLLELVEADLVHDHLAVPQRLGRGVPHQLHAL